MSGANGRLHPEISVIVVNWNGKRFLNACLSSLRRQTFSDFEVIVVDNGSEDGSAEYVRERFPEAKLIALGENRGFTGANIAGWKEANGKLMALLNNDTEVHPRWLEEIHKASVAFPNAGSFACKMLYFDKRDRIDNCGFAATKVGTTDDIGRGQRDGPAWMEPRLVFGACGGAVVYRRSMLEDVGFFDDDFFMTFEDVDLSFRAQLRGYACRFVPNAVVYHRYRATMNKFPARQVYFSQRNIELVYLKNMPLGLLLRSLPLRLLYEGGAAVYFFKIGAGKAFLTAKMDVFRQLPSVLRKRSAVQKARTITNGQLRSTMLGYNLQSKLKKFCSAWGMDFQAKLRGFPTRKEQG